MSTSASNKNTSIFRLGDLPKNVADRVVALPRDITTDVTQRGRQVWLAGLGALATVEQEGTSLFQTLVQQGEKLVERGEKLEVRGVKQVEMVREEFTARQRDTLEQLQKAESTLKESMMSTLQRLGVPSRAEVQELSANVDVLTQRVDALITRLDREPRGTAEPVPDPTV